MVKVEMEHTPSKEHKKNNNNLVLLDGKRWS